MSENSDTAAPLLRSQCARFRHRRAQRHAAATGVRRALDLLADPATDGAVRISSEKLKWRCTRRGCWARPSWPCSDWGRYSADTLTDDLDNTKWGSGANRGFYTLMNYGISVAKDGTVYYGLQDNASGKIEPDTRRQVRVYVGDGMWTAVDPDHSDIAYYQTPGLALVRTADGGRTTEYVDSFDVGTAHFLSAFRMDPQDANHLVAAGTRVAETLDAATDATWTTVFDLGVNDATGGAFQSRGTLAVQGDAAYVGACGPCNITAAGDQFRNRLATNVGGEAPPQKGTPDGWHVASANGLPNRYLYDIEADPANPETVYVVLGGYSTARWLPDGQYLDSNANRGSGRVFKSIDAGESFVDISGDLPDVITTAIIQRGEQLIVGTDIGVFISSDLDGSAWAPLGDLPSVPVNQLVLKPGDDRTLFAGTFGRGVQTYDFAKATDGGSGGGGTPDAGRFGGAMPGWRPADAARGTGTAQPASDWVRRRMG